MSEEEPVRYEVRDGIALITLNRPAKLNAVNVPMLRALQDALYAFDVDEAASVGILCGAGRAFSAGADIDQRVGSMEARGVTAAPRTAVLLSRFRNYKPIIAAVHGYTLGAGLILTLHSDYIVADPTACFQIIEVQRGLDGSSLWEYLRLRVSGAVADELALTGRRCYGEEAARIGLTNRLAPEGKAVEVAEEFARELMALPPLSVRTIVKSKRARLERLETDLSWILRERYLQDSDDYRESVTAMREKRPPRYQGR
jgi:enoyl-CoA hydratase/carnithine racemase